jgi:hypothetical protein
MPDEATGFDRHEDPIAPNPQMIGARADWPSRLSARLGARYWDHQIERGVPLQPGSPLMLHHARLTSFSERENLARALRKLLVDAYRPRTGRLIPIDRDAITESSSLIDIIALRLHAPLPVKARGMARLRILLSDGGGPVYRRGRATLEAQLRGVLAAL